MTVCSTSLRVGVLGGGLTGLSAAHRLTELARERGLAVEVTLFEARARWGGLVGTIEREGYLIDTGADSFLTNKPGAVSLCRRLGLEDRLQATEPRYRGALVLRRGRPVPVPEGFQLLSPTALRPVLLSPVLSPWGKLRLLAELFIPPRRDQADESLAAFVRRRFGREVLDRLVQPLVAGIYTSDPERLSLAATMPRFIEMERRHGSLIRAAWHSARDRSAAEADDRTSSGARYGLFAGLRGGMQDLVDALVQRVQSTCRLNPSAEVTAITPRHDPATGWRYALQQRDGREVLVDAVIVTLPTARAAEVLQAAQPDLATALRGIEYASSVIVVSGHRLSDIAHPLQAFGLVIPHIEHRRILAVSFSSRKFPNRAPTGRVLLRTFVGGALQPEFCDWDDSALRQLVLEELRDTLGVRGEPDFLDIFRYPHSMPQYLVGHRERVAEIQRLAARLPGLYLAGNAYEGVGVPDAIHSGECAAERLVQHLSTSAALHSAPV